MKLHGNAALSLNGRRRLVRMVLEEGRSLMARRASKLLHESRRSGAIPSGV